MSQDPRYFKASWGSVELWIAKITTNKGRKLVVQQYTRGNVPDVQNRGSVPQYAHCELLFDDLPGVATENGADRLNSLVTLAGLGEPQLFTHPIEGTYLAEIEDLDYDIDNTGTITGHATFLATEDVGAVVVNPLGASVDVDPDALTSSIADAQAELDDVGLMGLAPSAAKSASDVFSQANSAREMLVKVSQASDQIYQEIDDLKMAADIALWPLMKSYVMLGQAVGAAADVASGDTGNLMTLRVATPSSLRRLMADIYGAANAEQASQDAMSLNDIPTPARIPAGTQLSLRQPKKVA